VPDIQSPAVKLEKSINALRIAMKHLTPAQIKTLAGSLVIKLTDTTASTRLKRIACKVLEPYLSSKQVTESYEALYLDVINKNIDLYERADLYVNIKKYISKEYREQSVSALIAGLKLASTPERVKNRVLELLEGDLPKNFTL
jgi:hypothetical protein